jgi:predicted nucleic acid-binding protein
LIDSTVFIRAERDRKTPIELVADLMATWGDQELGLSAMSVEELFHGCWRADTVARRAARFEFVETMLAAVPVIPFTLAVARVFGEIDARLSTAGQRIPTSDLLIAATALSRGDQVITGNIRHFDRIRGLVVRRVMSLAPWPARLMILSHPGLEIAPRVFRC